MKKTLSLILALLMSLSTASVAFADEAAVIAEDVEATAVIEDVVEEETVAGPYDEALTYLKAYHIINGLGDGELGAEKAVKRYEMALFVSRISTGWVEDSAWATTNYTPYTDLEGSGASNVIGALTYADENGIIKGVGDNRFAPEAQVTYQDALTMAVRTLGYTNLSYPWGNITKAIELGLTEGIEDVAYTTPIARGVAAQIIYNALMAPTKNGGTLAAKNFNEFGWETVVITATSKDVLVDAKKAAAGFLGFQIVEDGELAETVYYADAAYFGLDATAYEDVLAIGASYDVLFEMNEDGLTNIVDIIDVKSNYVETLWNAEGETEIAGDYKLVTKYSETSNWLGTDAGKELIVIDALGGIVAIGDSNKRIGIDFATDDIVVYETKTAEDENGEEYSYVEIVDTLWYYNDVVGGYYQLEELYEGKLGIKYMDAKDEADLLKAIEEIKVGDATLDMSKGFAAVKAPKEVKTASAYASLDVFAVEGKYYGIFEEYRLGWFDATSTMTVCDAHNKNIASYSITNVFNMTKVVEIVGKPADVNIPLALNKTDCDHAKEWFKTHNTAWINPNFAANVTEDGEVLDGYVIYSADAQTGEIKIVKYIGEVGTEYATEDDYITSGMVRAYDIDKETVRINGVDYYFNYDNLAGNALINVTKDGKASYKMAYSDDLRDWFNQYVEIVVLDGEIVHMEIVPVADTEAFFVVERYAGVSSDGYLVADGYQINADEVKALTSVRISTVNNAYTGDLFYYLTEEKVDATFGEGTVYFVSSVDEFGALNVQLVLDEDGEYADWIDEKVDIKEDYVVDATDAKLLADKGKIVLGTDKVANDSRTYIFIDTDADVKKGEDVVVVYTGKLATGDYAVGDKLPISGAIVLVDPEIAEGAFNKATAATGLVALVNDRYWSASFDGAYAADEDWYLLGASEYVVEVFNFATANYETVDVRNLDLKEGYLYGLNGGKLVYDKKAVAGEADEEGKITETLRASIAGQFADVVIGDITLKTGFTADATADAIEEYVINGKPVYDLLGYSKAWKDLVSIKDICLVTLDTNKKGDVIITDIEEGFDKDDLAKLDEDADTVEVSGFYALDLDDGVATIYVFKNAVSVTGGADIEGGVASKNVITPDAETLDAYIDTVADVTVTTTDGDITGATVNAITVTFAGAAVEGETHQAIENKSYYFGNAGDCDFEDWNCTVDDEPVYGKSIEVEVYEDHDTEDICNLIKSVTIPVEFVLTDKNQYFVVEFTNNFGTVCSLTVGGRYEADEIIFGISGLEKYESSYGEFANVVAKADLK